MFLTAKAPEVRGLRGDFRVESKGRLKLRCKVTGNPFPWIEWFRNGKKLSNKRKGRVSIRNKRYARPLSPSSCCPFLRIKRMTARARKATYQNIATAPGGRPGLHHPALRIVPDPVPSLPRLLVDTLTLVNCPVAAALFAAGNSRSWKCAGCSRPWTPGTTSAGPRTRWPASRPSAASASS